MSSGEEVEKSRLQVGVEMIMNSKKHDVDEDNLVMDTKLKIIEIIKVCRTVQGSCVCVCFFFWGGSRVLLYLHLCF